MKRTTPVTMLLLATCAVFSAACTTTGNLDSQRVDGITIKPGYPLPVDAATLKENLRLSRGIELFLWSLPLNQSYSGRDGML